MPVALPSLMVTSLVWKLLLTVAAIGSVSSTIFLALVLIAVVRYGGKRQASESSIPVDPASLPAVTLLKPVHGMEPRLFENLESFFQQDYPNFEILIGARDNENAALQVAQEVRRKYPRVSSKVVLSGPPTWPNAKVYSLDVMIRETPNSFLVISDSDVLVGPTFLRQVIPPLLKSRTGLSIAAFQRAISGHDWKRWGCRWSCHPGFW